eukprot:TRINITY_DN107368_c0_g1_i1.p1 TRINITY_DN107368_c0_g1~~TRINITY_DN107368_c0_g1_i1.p1  ORF type:complete len:300 (+),score=76.55 TRINITY_DN107368_c0_g1_i1:86-985(+)
MSKVKQAAVLALGEEQAVDNLPPIVYLNVGGRAFDVGAATLRADRDNLLYNMVKQHYADGDAVRMRTDRDGRLFVDRNPDTFAVILEYLRTGVVFRPPNVSQQQLDVEMDYFVLPQKATAPDGSKLGACMIELPKHVYRKRASVRIRYPLLPINNVEIGLIACSLGFRQVEFDPHEKCVVLHHPSVSSKVVDRLALELFAKYPPVMAAHVHKDTFCWEFRYNVRFRPRDGKQWVQVLQHNGDSKTAPSLYVMATGQCVKLADASPTIQQHSAGHTIDIHKRVTEAQQAQQHDDEAKADN